MSNTTTCPSPNDGAPPSAIPEDPKGKVNYCVVPSGIANQTAARMSTCCAPNLYQVTADGCFDWCVLPDSYFKNGTATEGQVIDAWFSCLSYAEPGHLAGGVQCILPKAKSAASVVAPASGANLILAWAAALCLWQLLG